MTVVMAVAVVAMAVLRPHAALFDGMLSWTGALSILVGCALLDTYGSGSGSERVAAVEMWVAIAISAVRLLGAIAALQPLTVFCRASKGRGAAYDGIFDGEGRAEREPLPWTTSHRAHQETPKDQRPITVDYNERLLVLLQLCIESIRTAKLDEELRSAGLRLPN